MKTIFHSLRLISHITAAGLITHSGGLIQSRRLRFVGQILSLIFSPINLIKKPNKSFGARLTSCLERLGPIYIKFGQTLSSRPDLIGEAVAGNLKYLQDQLPYFSSEIAKQIIHSSLGYHVGDLFTSFEDIPVAAASIAQVHKAKLNTGEVVAVKILRPEIHKTYAEDIRLLYFLARIIPKLFPKLKRLRFTEIVDIFKNTMVVELDLRLEAAAASEIADNFKRDLNLYIPTIYWDMTDKQVMVTEWIDGISVYDTDKLLAANLVPREISKKFAILFFNQAYRDGFFHADLHPGNILVRADGSIALIDFGIMGRMAECDRLAISEILFSFLNRDYKRVADIHLKVGYVPKNCNLDLFAQSCRAVSEPIMSLQPKKISIGKLLTQLFKIIEDFGMQPQPQLILLHKTMIVVEGIGRSLDPETNMWQLAEPWIKKWAAKNLTPEAKILRLAKRAINNLLEQAIK